MHTPMIRFSYYKQIVLFGKGNLSDSNKAKLCLLPNHCMKKTLFLWQRPPFFATIWLNRKSKPQGSFHALYP